jgi:PAS domain-containing protein
VALTVSPILDGDRVIGVSAISQDVTDRKRQEKALRVQQQRTRAIIDTATDTFVAMDERGLITEWNRAAELAFGWTAGGGGREGAVGDDRAAALPAGARARP